VVQDHDNYIFLTPDYSSNIALQCSDVPGGWKSSNYVYWRYLTTATYLQLSLTSATTATGTPTLTFSPLVSSNNFLNWISSTSGIASYTGYYYGKMSITNSGQGTLTGTQTGVSNTLSLSFGFKLHNSNSFNLNISMNTQFQKPDALGDLIPSSVNIPNATLQTVYPTFWLAKSGDAPPVSSDIVTGLYSDNSANFYSVNSVSGTALCSGFSNDLFSRGTSPTDHVVSFQVQPYGGSRHLYYAFSHLNPGYIAATSKIPILYIQVGSGGWYSSDLSVQTPSTVTITTTPAPTDGGGSATYYYYIINLGGAVDITYYHVYWS
jgi:hypothetical protein